MQFKDYIIRYMRRNGLDEEYNKWFKSVIQVSILFSITGLLVGYFTQVTLSGTLIGLLVGFGLSIFFSVFNLTYAGYKRAKDIEDLLPDALELIGSGIKTGLSFRDSLEPITRPEFGPLSDEMSKVFVEESTGYTFEESLKRSSDRVSSQLYKKTIETLIRSMRSGIDTDKIAESLSKNINDIRNIKKDIKSSTVTYTLFLGFAALFASPILFSLSAFLVQSNAFLSPQGTQDLGSFSGAFSQASVSLPPASVLNNFFIISIIITAISTSIAIGIISKGSYKEGIKAMPFFVIFSIIMFLISKHVVFTMFAF